ncbi:MAG: hypothetical protein JJD92_02005 [Frankiaceae bacterium]|nr:hypothetical protein [Frankiaceae bacterium]
MSILNATPRRLVLVATLAATVALAALAVPAGAAKAPKLGPNLVVNPSFEASALEGTPATAPGSLPQPVLPTGWTFEGVSALFDHSPNVHHTGKRAAAISGTLSGGRDFCETGSCVDNPTNAVKDASASTMTMAPHWRTQSPIAVTAGKGYQLGFWGGTSIVTSHKGLDAIVRWVGANGVAVSQQTLVNTTDGGSSDFTKFVYKRVVPPAGATGAVLLFGQSDDAWIGQVFFDDIYFGTVG